MTSNGEFIISGDRKGTIKIWNSETGVLARTLSSHSSSVSALALSYGNKYIISGTVDKKLNIWSF